METERRVTMIWQLDLMILTLIVISAIAAITVRDLLSAAVIFGAYSFLMCLLWTEMGAVDVAFTEAAVGGRGEFRLLYRGCFQDDKEDEGLKIFGLLAVTVIGIMLLYAVGDFPDWADPASPASLHLSPHYITETIEETSVPNIVTSVLADYRGFDTMFETTVILAAGLAVLIILRRYRKKDIDDEDGDREQ